MLYLSWQEYDRYVHYLATVLLHERFECIYGIPNGGLVLATHLSYIMNKELVSLEEAIKIGRENVIIVDDCVDSGKQMKKFDDLDYRSAVLYHKPTSVVDATFSAQKTSEWIVFPWEI